MGFFLGEDDRMGSLGGVGFREGIRLEGSLRFGFAALAVPLRSLVSAPPVSRGTRLSQKGFTPPTPAEAPLLSSKLRGLQ